MNQTSERASNARIGTDQLVNPAADVVGPLSQNVTASQPSDLPKLNVMSSRFLHPYHRELYGQMADHVIDFPFPQDDFQNASDKTSCFQQIDIFHMHWPELVLDAEIASHTELIQTLKHLGIRIVWTQHNLLPHRDAPVWIDIYQAWANAADAVLHHSHWGKERALSFRGYAQEAIHAVIPHGHWGNLIENEGLDDGAEPGAEWIGKRERIQLGIMGAPREPKNVFEVVDSFLASDRADLELVIYSLRSDEEIPPHPRIYATRYRRGPRPVYNRRLSTIDVLILPFGDGGTMLTTGLVGDVVGMGIPALTSNWEYLHEMLGDAGIPFGLDSGDLTRCLNTLTREQLETAATASRKLQEDYSWSKIAAQTLSLLQHVASRDKGS